MGMQRTVLRFLAGGAAVAATAMLAFTPPASAQDAQSGEGPQDEVLEVSGDLSGGLHAGSFGSCGSGGDWPGPVPPGTDVRVSLSGSDELTGLGTSELSARFCIDVLGGSILRGSFTITTDDGTLSGGMTGGFDDVFFDPTPMRFRLTVDEGTGRFVDATGALTVEGSASFSLSGFISTVSGTVTIPPPVAGSFGDCHRGGWRDVVDDDGEPFRNQGLCVSFVRHL